MHVKAHLIIIILNSRKIIKSKNSLSSYLILYHVIRNDMHQKIRNWNILNAFKNQSQATDDPFDSIACFLGRFRMYVSIYSFIHSLDLYSAFPR